jgi:hypothetical protein
MEIDEEADIELGKLLLHPIPHLAVNWCRDENVDAYELVLTPTL